MLKLGSAKLIDQLKAISPGTPAIVFSGALSTCPDDILADVFLSKANCSAAQLLDHIRMALVRKRGPKPAVSEPHHLPPASRSSRHVFRGLIARPAYLSIQKRIGRRRVLIDFSRQVCAQELSEWKSREGSTRALRWSHPVNQPEARRQKKATRIVHEWQISNSAEVRADSKA